MRDFRQLKVWEKAHSLVLDIYRATEAFPGAERYALTSQIRRAAYSIPTNIAEASGRNTEADFARFLDMSMGSACELEYLLLLARDLGYLSPDGHHEHAAKLEEVKKMIARFVQRIRRGE